MPLTSAIWLEEFTVNLTTANTQSNPRVTQLANGNIMVVWDSTDNTGAGADLGIDLIGQLFNPLGEPIGSEFIVNHDFFSDDERNADVAALSTGGFLTVYEDFDGVNNNGSIRLTSRDADGLNPVTVTIIADPTNNADPAFLNPQVAVSGATSALVVYQEEEVGGDSRIAGKIYNPTTGIVGPEISLMNYAGTNETPVVTVLSNGNYVIAADTLETTGNSTITIRIISATGSNVLGATRVAATTGNGIRESSPSVTALDGGGFVVAWHENSSANLQSVKFQIFSDTGVAQGQAVNVVSGDPFGVDPFQPVVVALADGGFLVLYEDQQFFDLEGQRYDASGNAVGEIFFLGSTNSAAGDIDAELLADGRVAVTYTNNVFEVGMQILDTRDGANDPGVYTPEDWQIGTIGDDTITSDGDVFFVAGHDGDDTINTGGAAAAYLGGKGDDRINVIGSFDPADRWDGGNGNDTIDFSASFSGGGAFNLQTGTANITIGLAGIRTMTGFETLIGTEGNDKIITRAFLAAVDTIFAGGGNDTVTDTTSTGAGAQDSYDGGEGIDTLVYTGFGASARTVDMAQGILFAGSIARDTFIRFENITITKGAVNIIGDGENNILTTKGDFSNVILGGGGNDRLDGGAGLDLLLGGAGNDTYFVDVTEDQVFETASNTSLIDEGGIDTVVSAVSFNLNAYAGVRFVERLTLTGTGDSNGVGNALANRLTGNAGDNALNGGTGIDVMLGQGGNDTYAVDVAGDQVLETTTATSTIDAGGSDRVLSKISLSLDAYAGIRFVERLTLTETANISGTGNGLANLITGNTGNNVLNGGAGLDTLEGRAGKDTFVFNTALGIDNIDQISDFSVVDDTIRLDDAIFTGIVRGVLGANAFIANVEGVAASEDHRILYETDTGNLYFDSDGAGGDLRIHFATLKDGLALTEADFFVF